MGKCLRCGLCQEQSCSCECQGKGQLRVCQGKRDSAISARGRGPMRWGAKCVGSQSAECVAEGAVSGRSEVGVCARVRAGTLSWGFRGCGSGTRGPTAGGSGGRGLLLVASITRSAASKADIAVSGAARLADLILFISA